MLDAIPDLIDKKKMSGKDLPTEVFIKKKRMSASLSLSAIYAILILCLVAFWREKQIWRGGDETKYVEAIKISPAEGSCFCSAVLLMLITFFYCPVEIGICE